MKMQYICINRVTVKYIGIIYISINTFILDEMQMLTHLYVDSQFESNAFYFIMLPHNV